MKGETDFLGQIFLRVSKKIGKPYAQLAAFQEEMRKNWYDNLESVKAITDLEYQKMNIPLRVVTAIREEINQNLNHEAMEKNSKQRQININKTTNSLSEFKLTEGHMIWLAQRLQNELLSKYPWVGTQVPSIIQTLIKIIKNITSDPYQLKFRSLKKSNKKINQIIIGNQPVLKFLKDLGFQENQETVFLDRVQTVELFFIEECLQQIFNNQSKQNSMQDQHFNKIKDKQKDFFLPKDIKFPDVQQKDLNNVFSKQKLAEANYVDVLDKLIQYRNAIMQKPPNDRQLKIYHKRFQIKHIQLESFDLMNQFEKSDDKLVYQYWKELSAKKNTGFQSKRKVQFDFLIKQPIHKQTIIKIRLPNEIIIEARFGPLELLEVVFKYLADIVIGDMYLYQSPPVKKLDKDMKKTLMELDSVPNGSFYLGLNSQWYIKNEFIKMIRN